MTPMRFRVIDGCPVPAGIAPYVYIVLRDAGQTATSIYRGEAGRAVSILHAHGKHTQAEVHRMLPAISNPPGYSEHELRSDGPDANRGIPRGASIPPWMVGVDSGGDDEASKARVRHAAARHGWRIEHPYARGVEGHHWRFARKPHAHGLRMKARILKLRATLPRR